MMEAADDWYRFDAASEDFFNSLLKDTPYYTIAPGSGLQVPFRG
jgi:hypothetical protein